MTTRTAHPPAAGGLRGTTPDGTAGTPDRRSATTADELLRQARALLPRRPAPAEAHVAQARGALLIDIRGDDQRRAGGLIPGALVLPRNALEWRCDDPACLPCHRVSYPGARLRPADEPSWSSWSVPPSGLPGPLYR